MHQVVSDWRSAALAPEDQALCAFAVKLSQKADAMRPSDLEELRGHGLDDQAIHDATQVIGYFNYITRIADALGVEPETFIKRWGVAEDLAEEGSA